MNGTRMEGVGSARDVLVTEVLGEMGVVLDRLEALAPVLDACRRQLLSASSDLNDRVAAVEIRMAGATENAKVQTVKYVARRTDELARSSAEAQTRAMEDSARRLFEAELGPALRRMAMPMQHLAVLAERGAHPWRLWLSHLATAVVSSGLGWALAAWLWVR